MGRKRLAAQWPLSSPTCPISAASSIPSRTPRHRSTMPIGMRNSELKKELRGVRPIERAVEEYPPPENDAIRGYCLAVRASLTDDGRSPLDAPGLRLYERVAQISDSIGRIQEKKACPRL